MSKKIGKFLLVETVSSSPREKLVVLEDDAGNRYFGKRQDELFRNDPGANRLLELEISYMEKINSSCVLQFAELVKTDSEALVVYPKPKGVDLLSLLNKIETAEIPERNSIRVYLIKQIIALALELRNVHNQDDSTENTLIADFRPESFLIDTDGNIRAVFLSLSQPESILNSINPVDDRQYIAYAAPEQVVPGVSPDWRATLFGLGTLKNEKT